MTPTNKNCAFTIVAKNYIGLGLILEESIKRYNSNTDFYIIVADEMDEEFREFMPGNVIEAKGITELTPEEWEDMSFKYNLTEFCTSIKPFVFKIFLNHGYDKIVYLDPDIYFYGDIIEIFDSLNDKSIILTPHLTTFPKLGSTDSPENIWNSCGIFNLGFCGIKNTPTARRIMKWWGERLKNMCFIDRLNSEYTDQKWMDFIPAIVPNDELVISKSLGWNFAPWNFFERKIIKNHDKLYVTYRDNDNTDKLDSLLFVHYSGFDYVNFLSRNFSQHNIKGLNMHDDLIPIFESYALAISEKSDFFNLTIKQVYSYNYYEDNSEILYYHRRIYAELPHNGSIRPFSSKGKFRDFLCKNKLITKTKNIEKTFRNDSQKTGNKIALFNKIFKYIYRLLGSERYFILLRFLRNYTKYSNQINIFSK